MTVVCPLLMYHFLTKVTGIPLTEEYALKSKGEAYGRYQQDDVRLHPLVSEGRAIEDHADIKSTNSSKPMSIPDPLIRIGIRHLLGETIREKTAAQCRSATGKRYGESY